MGALTMAARMGFVLMCLLLIIMTANGQESLADKNKRDIDKHQEILQDNVMADLQTLKEKFKNLVEHVNGKLTELRAYTTEAIQKLKEDADSNMRVGDTTIKENTDKLEAYIREKINDLNTKMGENLKALSSASSDQRMFIRDWNDKRSQQHENILGTHVSLCAYDHGDFADVKALPQVVTYNSTRGGFLDQRRCWPDQRTTTRQRRWKSSTERLASSRYPKMLPDSTCSPSPSQWTQLTSTLSHHSTSLKRMETRSLGQASTQTLDSLILWQAKLQSMTRFRVQTPSFSSWEKM